MYLWPKHVRGRYSTRLTGPKRPRRTLTAGARPSLKGRLASVAVRTPPALAHASPCPRLLLSSSFATMRMPYQCVRTCPGARGWGEAWAVGAVPSSCTEMAPHVVVVCSTCQPRPAAGDGWAASIMRAEEVPHLIQPVAQAWTADRSLVSKRTRQRVCHEWFKVAMVPAQFG